MYRALETERPDALFQDPFARLLAGGKGEILLEVVGDKRHGTDAIAVRTYVIEELIRQVIESKGIDTVLSLGAGLDTRPYRLSLPSSLRWIEVDLPTILSHKEQKLKNQQPKCSLELVKLDLADIMARNALFSSFLAEWLASCQVSLLLGRVMPTEARDTIHLVMATTDSLVGERALGDFLQAGWYCPA